MSNNSDGSVSNNISNGKTKAIGISKKSIFDSNIPADSSEVKKRIALHNFIKETARDNYITGAYSGKFVLFTALIYILLITVLFGYDILIKMDSIESASLLNSKTKTVLRQVFDGAGNDITDTIGLTFEERSAVYREDNKISTAQLSNTTLANIALVFAVIIFGFLWILKWTRPIPYEFAFFIAAIWIVFGSLAKTECVCCSSSSSSVFKNANKNINDTSIPPKPSSANSRLDGHIHPVGTYIFDAVNHWMHTSGLCDYLPLITALHSIAIIIMVALLYVAIHREYDYFRIERYARRELRNGIAQKDNESMMLLTTRERTTLSGLTSLDVPWLKVLLILVVLILALIPFACNNAVEVTIENYFLRIILFLFIFLLRLVNTYSGRYILYKFSMAFNAMLSLPDKGASIDKRIADPKGGDDEELEEDSGSDSDEDEQYGDISSKKMRDNMKNNNPDATSTVSSAAKTQLISRNVSRSAVVNIVIDSLIASLVLLVCGWFLLIAIAQVLYEFIILYKVLEKYEKMNRQLQIAYNSAQKRIMQESNVSTPSIKKIPIKRTT